MRGAVSPWVRELLALSVFRQPLLGQGRAQDGVTEVLQLLAGVGEDRQTDHPGGPRPVAWRHARAVCATLARVTHTARGDSTVKRLEIFWTAPGGHPVGTRPLDLEGERASRGKSA